MKKVILFMFLMPYLASAQVMDNFESGDLKNWFQNIPGRWKADTMAAISGDFSLHHVFDNPEGGTDILGIQINNLHPDEGKTVWSFTVRHGYEPSSSNNWIVFLLSESGPERMSAAECTGAFAIGVNITGSDDSLRFVRIDNGNISTIVNCGINWQSDIGPTLPVKIITERSESGLWKIQVFKYPDELIRSSTATDQDLISSDWFGICYKYSSTKDRLLWIDDIRIDGMFYADTVPPRLEKCIIKGPNSLEITLSEELSESISEDSFSLNGEKATSLMKINELVYNVFFSTDLINKKPNTLIIAKVCDQSGNCAEQIKHEFTYVTAETGDVVISEIMADPVPPVSIPDKEYIEIINRTDLSFNLQGWTLLADDETYPFPAKIINPHGIMILCHRSDSLFFRKYGIPCGFSSFPALNDNSKLICLLDSTGMLIHGVEYSSGWYGESLKSEGGWSLEMIDIGYPFFTEGNWIASSSRTGGTPGIINSSAKRNPDTSFEGLLNVFPVDSLQLSVTFSETVLHFNGLSEEIEIGGTGIKQLFPLDPLLRNFGLILSGPLARKTKYEIQIPSELSDVAGNKIQKNKYAFGMPETALKGDILFNELLFNPLQGNSDYIEFYNASPKIIDASRLFLVSVNDDNADTSELIRVSNAPRCIMPSGYYTISEEKKEVEKTFTGSNSDFIFSADELPAMPDEKGHLILFNRELDVIDEVYYNEKMHNPLLSVDEGISLEKSDPELPSAESLNWHSAAESSGWGTPGNVNSIFTEFHVNDDQVNFSSTRITPDADGFEDLLNIGFKFPGTDNIISVTVFDESGSLVRKIATNFLSGPESTLIWDGTANDGSLVRSGIYIILITYYNDTGQRGRWKKVCTVIRR